MSRRSSRRSTPLAFFWSRAEQRRFIDAVERLVSTVNDFQMLLAAEREKRSEAARKANRMRRRNGEQQAAVDPTDPYWNSGEGSSV